MQTSTLHLSLPDLEALIVRASGQPLPAGVALAVEGERLVLSLPAGTLRFLPQPLELEFHGADRRDGAWVVRWAARGLGVLARTALKVAWPMVERAVRGDPRLSRVVVALDRETVTLDLDSLPVGDATLREIATVTELRLPGDGGAAVSAEFRLVR